MRATNAMLVVVTPFSFVLPTARPDEDSKPVDHSVFPLAEVASLVDPLVLPGSVHFIIGPFAGVRRPVLPDVAPDPLLPAIPVPADVTRPVLPLVLPPTVMPIFQPASVIYVSVFPDVLSLPVPSFPYHLSNVDIPVMLPLRNELPLSI
jgi:hypothetical protein